MRIRREIVLVDAGCDPRALLVEDAPEIKQAWLHRLLDPVKLQLLDPKHAKLELVADDDAVCVFAVPLATRAAITKLAGEDPAWQVWLDSEDLRLDGATLAEARALHDLFKRVALMSAIGGGDAYVRIWFRQLGVY
jgi:hypothetical protein